MRNRFDEQYSLFVPKIEDMRIPTKSRDAIAAQVAGLQLLFLTPKYRDQVLGLVENALPAKRPTGRKGLNLWQIFVLAQCRVCFNISYDRLHIMVNYNILIRQLLGISDFASVDEMELGYQRIYDNVSLLSDELMIEINTIIVQMGHEVFKKKETAALRLKTDSYVVESNVHFPTDYNLLFDSARKALDTVAKIDAKYPNCLGMRKAHDWNKKLKNLKRALGRACSGGGKNKSDRVKRAVEQYLKKSEALLRKLQGMIPNLPDYDLQDWFQIETLKAFIQLLEKHIDLVDRRLLKGEKIPHEEKLFSIFEQYTEWLSKGKMGKKVELGKNVSITTDQYNMIVDYHIMEHESDSRIVQQTAIRVLDCYEVQSWSFDKGYWHPENKAYLASKIDKVVMPKKGKCNKEEKEEQSTKRFKQLRNMHSAVESNINELEHRGLDRCPDKGYHNFKRYIGLGIISYNLHKIGKHLITIAREKEKLEAEARKAA